MTTFLHTEERSRIPVPSHGPFQAGAVGLVSVLVFAVGCVAEVGDTADRSEFPFEVELGDGKGDSSSSVRILGEIALSGGVEGHFEDRIRTYAFTFEAEAGFRLAITLDALAGPDSWDHPEGAGLNTVLAIFGPMVGSGRGARLAYHENDDRSPAWAIPTFEVPYDGQYLVAFGSWTDPGRGTYRVEVGCEGGDGTCAGRESSPCRVGTRYVPGGELSGRETWSDCTIVLLDTVRVAPDAVLTIQPGVEVYANFLGNDAFGRVALEVDGVLRAVGTAERPVVFTALADGWRGLLLRGSGNELRHVVIEKARFGVHVGPDSVGNRLAHARIALVETGVRIEGGAVAIEDSVILGRGPRASRSGVDARGSGQSHFHRALVGGFEVGLRLDASDFDVVDSTITGNRVGVVVTGEDERIAVPVECPSWWEPSDEPPLPPESWRRLDPHFLRCDIVNNEHHGLKVLAPEWFLVEETNLVGNGAGVFVGAHSLHPSSRITGSNLSDNGSAPQVDSLHVHGVLDLSGNYWDGAISDPELSANWRFEQTMNGRCGRTRWMRPSAAGCVRLDGMTHQCGQEICRFLGIDDGMASYACILPWRTTWAGEHEVVGFSPFALPAGPNPLELSENVLRAREAYGL
jgi:hypothetical protein